METEKRYWVYLATFECLRDGVENRECLEKRRVVASSIKEALEKAQRYVSSEVFIDSIVRGVEIDVL